MSEEKYTDVELVWQEAVGELFRDHFRLAMTKFKKYFHTVKRDQEEEFLEVFAEKESKILTLGNNLEKKKGVKLALRFLREFARLLKSFEEDYLVEMILNIHCRVIHKLQFPEDKLKEIEKAKLFLKDYGQEGLRYLDLSVMEAELIQQVGDIEKALMLILETISEVGTQLLTTGDEEFEGPEIKDSFFDGAYRILAKAYIRLSTIYQVIKDENKAYKSIENASKYILRLKDQKEKDFLADAYSRQKDAIFNPEINLERLKNPTKKHKFNLNESVKRLYSGKGVKHKNYHYDSCPNQVFIRENPFVREKMHGVDGYMDASSVRLHNGQGFADPDLRVHEQAFKNYSREGFLPHDHFGYKPKDYHPSSVEGSPAYKEGAKRDRIELVHAVKLKPLREDHRVGASHKNDYEVNLDTKGIVGRQRDKVNGYERTGKVYYGEVGSGIGRKGDKARRYNFLKSLG